MVKQQIDKSPPGSAQAVQCGHYLLARLHGARQLRRICFGCIETLSQPWPYEVMRKPSTAVLKDYAGEARKRSHLNATN